MLAFPLSQLHVRAYRAIDIAPVDRVMAGVLFRCHVMERRFQVFPKWEVLPVYLADMSASVP